MALFDAFKGDVAKRLLFLRYIESIEFYVCDGTPTAPDVKLLFRAGKTGDGDGGEEGKGGVVLTHRLLSFFFFSFFSFFLLIPLSSSLSSSPYFPIFLSFPLKLFLK